MQTKDKQTPVRGLALRTDLTAILHPSVTASQTQPHNTALERRQILFLRPSPLLFALAGRKPTPPARQALMIQLQAGTCCARSQPDTTAHPARARQKLGPKEQQQTKAFSAAGRVFHCCLIPGTAPHLQNKSDQSGRGTRLRTVARRLPALLEFY